MVRPTPDDPGLCAWTEGSCAGRSGWCARSSCSCGREAPRRPRRSCLHPAGFMRTSSSARRPALRLLRGLRLELRARRDLLPRDRRARTALLAAARPPPVLSPLVSLRLRGGRRRLHAARDRGTSDGRAVPGSAVPERMDARAGPPERRRGHDPLCCPRGSGALRRARLDGGRPIDELCLSPPTPARRFGPHS